MAFRINKERVTAIANSSSSNDAIRNVDDANPFTSYLSVSSL
jgi:hypothetical protein